LTTPNGESVPSAPSWEGLSPPYSTIVVDPPWDHSDGTGKGYRLANPQRGRTTPLPYSCMSVADIAALPVGDLAARDSHLYLWTTNRYLRDAYDVVAAWGFSVSKPLVWCKEPKGFFGPPFVSSAEFVLYARRGSLPAQDRVDRQWWVWPRSAHSAKPPAFLDVVERVSPGPYVELFARAPRLGWDSWGKGYELPTERETVAASVSQNGGRDAS
jgi:N6-adenosine-specific RNA methylase IME4